MNKTVQPNVFAQVYTCWVPPDSKEVPSNTLSQNLKCQSPLAIKPVTELDPRSDESVSVKDASSYIQIIRNCVTQCDARMLHDHQFSISMDIFHVPLSQTQAFVRQRVSYLQDSQKST